MLKDFVYIVFYGTEPYTRNLHSRLLKCLLTFIKYFVCRTIELAWKKLKRIPGNLHSGVILKSKKKNASNRKAHMYFHLYEDILLLLRSNITKTRLSSHAGFTSVCLNVATWIHVGANGHDTYVKYTCIRTHLRRTGPGRPRSRQASGCRRCQRRAATGTTTKSSAPKNATTRNSAHAVYSSDKHTILDPLFQTQYQTTQSLVHAKTPVNLRVLYDILKNSRISSQTDKCSDVSLR